MVFTAGQLEVKHCGYGSGCIRYHGNGMERQCGEGIQAKNAGEGEILSEPIVRATFFSTERVTQLLMLAFL